MATVVADMSVSLDGFVAEAGRWRRACVCLVWEAAARIAAQGGPVRAWRERAAGDRRRAQDF